MDYNDRIYAAIDGKFDALVEEINTVSKAGRPVLVGTTSVEKSEKLSEMLTRRYGIRHEVLNARPENARREADIVAQAGFQSPLKPESKEMVGNVTVATNMAGRGTDIKLGAGVVYEKCRVPSDDEVRAMGFEPDVLYPAGVNKCCMVCDQHDPATNCAHCFKPKVDDDFPLRGRVECPKDVPCGLHIVGTERHEARRIDNQLRGRSGRQGDPGSSRFFLSLRDELMAIFAGEWAVKVLGWLGLQGDMAIEDKRISNGIARAQRKVEERNFEIRKQLLESDEVMDHQRKAFYGRRQQVLEGRDLRSVVQDMLTDSVRLAVSKNCGNLAATKDTIYLAAGARCIGFDAETGKEKIVIKAPQPATNIPFDWGYVACSGDQLFGTAAIRIAARKVQTNSSWTWGYLDRSEIGCSYQMYSFDRHKGRQQWAYTPQIGTIINPTIAIADGRIYFVESINPETRKAPGDRIILATLLGKGTDVVALDARTGRTVWRTAVDLKALQHTIFLAHAGGMLVISGSKNIGGGRMRYDLLALDAATGKQRWATTPATNGRTGGSHGEQDQHPAIVGGIIYYKTFAVDLKTGKRVAAWKPQGGGCGTVSTSAHSMFYRSGNPIITDLATGKAQRMTIASRPGCWINIIPAGGLVIVPEASSGCTCGYPIQTSLAMVRVACPAPKIETKRLSAKMAAVTISSSRGDVVIRYTTDGSLPTTRSAVYERPLELAYGVTIRARAFSHDGEKSVAAELALKPPKAKKTKEK